MKLEKLFKEMRIEKDNFEDLHIVRFFSSFVAISKEKVIRMTEPFLEYCPLADSLYDNMKGIRRIVEEKIAKFGHFTAERKLYREDVAIPYGASEMMMYALAIPVFVLTEKGLDFITSYSSSEKAFENLDTEKQYLISGRYKGIKVRMGDFNTYLSETELSVRSEKEPSIRNEQSKRKKFVCEAYKELSSFFGLN